MTGKDVTVSGGEICPYLGLAENPSIRYFGASSLHRCHSESTPLPVNLREQRAYCLSDAYPSCPRWQGDGDELEEAGLFGFDWRAIRERASGAGTGLLVGLFKIAWGVLAVAAFILLAPMLGTPDPSLRAGGVPPDSSAGVDWLMRPVPAGEPVMAAPLDAGQDSGAASAVGGSAEASSARPATTAASGQRPEARATAQATAVPTPQKAPNTPVPQSRTYVVQAKDTLWSVARSHGVNVDELARVNGLKDKNVLKAGQKLVIPVP